MTKLDKDRSRDDSFSIHIDSSNDSFDQDQITENSLKIIILNRAPKIDETDLSNFRPRELPMMIHN